MSNVLKNSSGACLSNSAVKPSSSPHFPVFSRSTAKCSSDKSHPSFQAHGSLQWLTRAHKQCFQHRCKITQVWVHHAASSGRSRQIITEILPPAWVAQEGIDLIWFPLFQFLSMNLSDLQTQIFLRMLFPIPAVCCTNFLDASNTHHQLYQASNSSRGRTTTPSTLLCYVKWTSSRGPFKQPKPCFHPIFFWQASLHHHTWPSCS